MSHMGVAAAGNAAAAWILQLRGTKSLVNIVRVQQTSIANRGESTCDDDYLSLHVLRVKRADIGILARSVERD